MKLQLLIVFFFIGGPFLKAQAHNLIESDTDTVKDVRIEKSQIIYNKNILGRIKTTHLHSKNSKSENYKVEVFCKQGRLVAEYEVEVLNKHRKNQDAILSAYVKTVIDNVVHYGSNFIDFHKKSEEHISVLQVEKVVKYLFTYKYLR